MSGIELPEHERGKTSADTSKRDQQIAALIDIIGNLAKQLTLVEGRVNRLTKTVNERDGKPTTDNQDDPAKPAAWVWFTPPAGAEDQPDSEQDPRVTVDKFVAWYNLTFVGIEGSRSTPIPHCWQQHPGLAMEVAALADNWRAANVGPTANIRDAQYWLHQWRPGFAERLTRDWTHADCLDGDHRDGGPPPRTDRFTLAEQHTAATELDQRDCKNNLAVRGQAPSRAYSRRLSSAWSDATSSSSQAG
jgi:hypothetical protein